MPTLDCPFGDTSDIAEWLYSRSENAVVAEIAALQKVVTAYRAYLKGGTKEDVVVAYNTLKILGEV